MPSTIATPISQIELTPDSAVRISGVSWQSYVALLQELGDQRPPPSLRKRSPTQVWAGLLSETSAELSFPMVGQILDCNFLMMEAVSPGLLCPHRPTQRY